MTITAFNCSLSFLRAKEDVFSNPLHFDMPRAEPPHLGCGIGQHYYLEARLAEIQLRIFFGEFLNRYPNAQLSGPIRCLRSNFVASIKEMPIRLR